MGQTTNSASDNPAIGRVSVLLVEDNRVNRIVATRMLARIGCEATIAENGQLALDILEDPTNKFDLVFMDVQMPVMDGLTAVGRIRSKGRYEKLPVVAMTAHAMVGDRERCLDAGMDDYFTKPVKIEQVRAMIEKWKAGRTPSTSETTNEEPGSAESNNQTTPDSESNSPCPIAMATALANLDGDMELLEEVVQVFLETTPIMLADLNEAVKSGNAAEITAAAHSIKGASANIGALIVSETARKLELMGKTEEIADAAKETEELIQEIDALVSFAKEKFASCADVSI